MAKICEKMVNAFVDFFYGKNSSTKKDEVKRDEYTLSSVFPTPKIMKDVKKII